MYVSVATVYPSMYIFPSIIVHISPPTDILRPNIHVCLVSSCIYLTARLRTGKNEEDNRKKRRYFSSIISLEMLFYFLSAEKRVASVMRKLSSYAQTVTWDTIISALYAMKRFPTFTSVSFFRIIKFKPTLISEIETRIKQNPPQKSFFPQEPPSFRSHHFIRI